MKRREFLATAMATAGLARASAVMKEKTLGHTIVRTVIVAATVLSFAVPIANAVPV